MFDIVSRKDVYYLGLADEHLLTNFFLILIRSRQIKTQPPVIDLVMSFFYNGYIELKVLLLCAD